MVHQRLVNPRFSVLENIILGYEGGKPIIEFDVQRKRVQDLMESYGLNVELNSQVKDLAVGDPTKGRNP